MTPDFTILFGEITKERVVEKSHKIFEKGEDGTTMYVIVEGSVRIHMKINLVLTKHWLFK